MLCNGAVLETSIKEDGGATGKLKAWCLSSLLKQFILAVHRHGAEICTVALHCTTDAICALR